jgi:chemotaxis signal transduction protein
MSTTTPIDPAWQREWASAYAAPLAPRESRAQAAMLEFKLGRETYALPVADVSAATERGTIVALPGRRERLVCGLFHLDGQLILAADLRRLLRPAELPPHEQGGHGRFPRMLILGQGADTFAVAVDDVPGTFRLPSSPLQAIPLTASARTAGLACGMLRRESGHLTVLDGTQLLATLAQDLR